MASGHTLASPSCTSKKYFYCLQHLSSKIFHSCPILYLITLISTLPGEEKSMKEEYEEARENKHCRRETESVQRGQARNKRKFEQHTFWTKQYGSIQVRSRWKDKALQHFLDNELMLAHSQSFYFSGSLRPEWYTHSLAWKTPSSWCLTRESSKVHFTASKKVLATGEANNVHEEMGKR